MKKYKFLLRPLFFIFNLVFATCMVFKIEQISPSDFGRYKSLFENPPIPNAVHTPRNYQGDKQSQFSLKPQLEDLKKICFDYKSGLIDSIVLEQQLKKKLQFVLGDSI